MEAAQLQRSAPGLPEGERAFILHGIVDGKGREQQDAKVSPIHPAVKRCCSGLLQSSIGYFRLMLCMSTPHCCPGLTDTVCLYLQVGASVQGGSKAPEL